MTRWCESSLLRETLAIVQPLELHLAALNEQVGSLMGKKRKDQVGDEIKVG
jgi:hypothetical protein